MPSQTAARKAWNEAMKATAGATALPPALQQRTTKRRSDRNKKQERRTKARKVLNQSIGDGDDIEEQQYRAAIWVDALEGIDPNKPQSGIAGGDEDDEYDELDDFDSGGGKGKKRGRGRGGGGGSKGGKAGGKSKAKSTTGVLPKRFMPRSMASILIEEASREDGTARAYLNAEARITTPSSSKPSTTALRPKRRKYCPVTGVLAKYTEPKTGIPYANMRALEQIRERPPPWMTLSGVNTASYWETVKSIRDD